MSSVEAVPLDGPPAARPPYRPGIPLAAAARQPAARTRAAGGVRPAGGALPWKILAAAPQAFVLTAAGGVVVEWNARAERLFGWPREEIVGRPLRGTLLPPGDGDPDALLLPPWGRDGADGAVQVTLRHRSGRPLPVTATATAFQRPEGVFLATFFHQTGRPAPETTRGATPSGVRAAWLAERIGGAPTAGDLAAHLRDLLVSALHLGRVEPGDRLPSIREVARRAGTTVHRADRAYRALCTEGLVERRSRSGVFVAAQDQLGNEALCETARWMVEMLAGAGTRRIKIPQLPGVVRRWTGWARFRCGCIAPDVDTQTALRVELGQHFGFDVHMLDAEALPGPGEPLDPGSVAAELRGFDLFVTTAFHAPGVRRVAQALGTPMVVATRNPEHVTAVEERARTEGLTVVCVDRGFGEQVRRACGHHEGHVRVVTVDDARGLESIDPAEPVLLTRAAHRCLREASPRLLIPFSPFLAPRSVRAIGEVLVQLNRRADQP